MNFGGGIFVMDHDNIFGIRSPVQEKHIYLGYISNMCLCKKIYDHFGKMS